MRKSSTLNHRIAALSAKVTVAILKLLHLGAGTSLPGKIARRLDPGILPYLGAQVRQNLVAVSGTNGKSTTCGLLAQFLREGGRQVAHNQLGANMVAGITAALLKAGNWTGCLQADDAVLEVDEASLKGVTRELNVSHVVVTNLFRDQLDRYGELDTTARLLAEGIQQTRIAQNTGCLILNADDPLVSALGKPFESSNPPLYFGIDTITYQHPIALRCPVEFPKESVSCQACGADLRYERVTFGHLGIYACTRCGAGRPTPDILAKHVRVMPEASEVELLYGAETLLVTLPLPGLFNAYNLLAAAAAAYSLGLPSEAIVSGLHHYQSLFGRAERKTLMDRQTLTLLIKNPVGAGEVLRLVAGDPQGRLLIALNDDYADGRDVSWIWDAPFELIPADKPLVVSGRRAADMAVRLKYAGILPENIAVEPDLKQALRQALAQTQAHETLYILPTYTALLQLSR